MRPAISVRNVSKEFVLGERGRYYTLRETLGEALRLRRRRPRPAEAAGSRGVDRLWALKDVSFDVAPGEVVGIIGHNGAGKSTLLKILSRITEPTEGEIEIYGRVSSLLEVGTGFHSELTGRENIFLNGSILGMKKREIDAKFDEIVDFSGVERFLDTPVKRYSSGMQVRLAFAVAAHLEPEVLLVDEVLAVGDAEFQRKCLGKMSDVARGGRTILFVSHNMAAVERLCGRCILLGAGQLVRQGETNSIISHHLNEGADDDSATSDLIDHRGRRASAESLMTKVRLGSSTEAPNALVRAGEDLTVSVKFNRKGKPFRPVLGLVVKSNLGVSLFSLDNRIIAGFEFEPTSSGEISCRVPRLPLMPGRYHLDLYLGDEHKSIDSVMDAIGFDVIATDIYGSGRLPPANCGPFLWSAEWSLGCAASE
jgi:lipopolysaccharide transport system ATP-binding protein